MSEDSTLKMGADTKPIIETLLERIEIRLDRVESMALETRATSKSFAHTCKETVSK